MTRVHLVARDNGAGLSRDLAILRLALVEAGFDLTISAIGQGGIRRQIQFARLRAALAWRAVRGRGGRFDVNLMDERIRPRYVPLARRNVLMPHPEWFDPAWTKWLPQIDRVFAKTRHAVPLFEALGGRAEFVGFTSLDRRDRSVPREIAFFHLGGRSRNKGTQPVVDAWLRHPEWPPVVIVQRAPLALPERLPANLRLVDTYLDDDELKRLQNAHAFHLCPSETEGFGHHLVEGMSCGAITLATDAPPMNEMVANGRGVLVPYSHTGTQRLATTYFVDASAIETGVGRLLALDASARRSMSEAARAWWEDNDHAFRARLKDAIRALADGKD